MYHEIQAEDEIHSKKSASTGSSSAIKSRSRVKSMSKHDQFIRLTHFLFAIKSGLGVKSGWRLDILFTLVLLFIVLETDFLLYVLSPAWISWYIFSTLFTTFRPIKSTLYSVFYNLNKTKKSAVFSHFFPGARQGALDFCIINTGWLKKCY